MVLISLSACGNNVEKQYPWEIGSENTFSFKEDKVTISIESNTITSTGTTFKIENIGNESITFNQAYAIQIEIDKKWYFIDDTQHIILESITLMPDESISIVLDWTNTYGELPLSKISVD